MLRNVMYVPSPFSILFLNSFRSRKILSRPRDRSRTERREANDLYSDRAVKSVSASGSRLKPRELLNLPGKNV